MVRRSYILLEVIIAIALVALVGFLLIRAPMKSVYKEWEMVVDMERARLWNNFLIEFEQGIPTTVTPSEQKRVKMNIKPEPLDIKMGQKEFKKTQYYVVWWNHKNVDKTDYYDVCLEELEKNELPSKSNPAKTHHFFYKKEPPKVDIPVTSP